MRCRICNTVADPMLEDELARLSNKRFYPDPEGLFLSLMLCTDCAEDVYGDLENLEAERDTVGYELDRETEEEVFAYLEELDGVEND